MEVLIHNGYFNQEQELRLVRLQAIAFYARELCTTISLPAEHMIFHYSKLRNLASNILQEISVIIYQEQYKQLTSPSNLLSNSSSSELPGYMPINQSKVVESFNGSRSKPDTFDFGHGHIDTSLCPPLDFPAPPEIIKIPSIEPFRMLDNNNVKLTPGIKCEDDDEDSEEYEDDEVSPNQSPNGTPSPKSTSTQEQQPKNQQPRPNFTSGKVIGEDEVSKLVSRKRRMRKGKPVVIRGQSHRVCDWCGCSKTPEWRKGPKHELLCNACGLQYKKYIREHL